MFIGASNEDISDGVRARSIVAGAAARCRAARLELTRDNLFSLIGDFAHANEVRRPSFTARVEKLIDVRVCSAALKKRLSAEFIDGI